MDSVRSILLGALGLVLVGCVSVPDTLQEAGSDKQINAGGMSFYFDPSESCGENVTCYSSANYSFGVSDLKASGLQSMIDRANNRYNANISSNPEDYVITMSNLIRDIYNSSYETVEKMGRWSNNYGKLYSEKGYKMYLGHVSDSPDELSFFVTVMCIPDAPCEFSTMTNIFSDIEKQLLESHDLSKPLT